MTMPTSKSPLWVNKKIGCAHPNLSQEIQEMKGISAPLLPMVMHTICHKLSFKEYRKESSLDLTPSVNLNSDFRSLYLSFYALKGDFKVRKCRFKAKKAGLPRLLLLQYHIFPLVRPGIAE